jgi:hypothetical protein
MSESVTLVIRADDIVSELRGDGMPVGVTESGHMRMFCLYNRMYTLRCVVAPDLETAKQIAIKAGHVRQPFFRRVSELKIDDPEFDDVQREALSKVLAGTIQGVAEFVNDEWVVDEESGRLK